MLKGCGMSNYHHKWNLIVDVGIGRIIITLSGKGNII